MSSKNKPAPLRGLFALLSFISLFSITLVYQNCSPAKFGAQLAASVGGLGTVGLGNACASGTAAVGIDANGQFICEPIVSVNGTSCPANSFVYSYNSQNVVIGCISIVNRQTPPNQYCHPGYYLTSVSSSGALVCQSTPGATPNTCSANSYPIGIAGNGSLICSNVPTSDISCSVGNHLVGINNQGQAICEPLPQLAAEGNTCPSGKALIGLDANSNPVCQTLFNQNKPEQSCVGLNARDLSTSGLNLDCQPLPTSNLSHVCPAGSYLSTVTGGEIDCVGLSSGDVFNGSCPAGEFLLGFNQGQPVCEQTSLGSLPAFCPAGTHAFGISNANILCRQNPLTTPMCVPGSQQSCLVYNAQAAIIGSGQQTCNQQGQAWSTCQATACDTSLGYQAAPVNGVCQLAVLNCPTGLDIVNGQCVDTKKPIVTLDQVPADSKSKSANIVFTANDHGQPLANLECLLDGNPLASCSSPLALSNLPVGQRNIVVRATDGANQVTSATHSWNVLLCDRAAEDTLSCNGIANGVGARYCQADGLAFETTCTAVSCNAGYTKQGNSCVDNTAPVVNITSQAVSSGQDKKLAYSITEAGSGVARTVCSLNGNAVSNCLNPHVFSNLAYGAYKFKVMASDNSGNTGEDEYSFNKFACSAGASMTCTQKDSRGITIGTGKRFCAADRFSYKSTCEQIQCIDGYKLQSGKCVIADLWFTVSSSTRISGSNAHASLCASKGHAPSRNRGDGICQSVETERNSRNRLVKSKVGTVLINSRGIAHCYGSTQKRDYDYSDRAIRVLCDTSKPPVSTTTPTNPTTNPPYSGGGGGGIRSDGIRTIEN